MSKTEVLKIVKLNKYIFTLILGSGLLVLPFAARSAEKTFIYCSEASPSTFSPSLATDGPTFTAAARTVYNRLLEFERGGTKLIPSLATSWTVSKDGKIVTFKLRKGVKFHSRDGFKPTRDFNADDVLFSFNRMRDNAHPYNKVSGGTYEYFKSMELDKLITDISKTDDMTVKFILSKPEAPFLADIAMDFASIASAEYGAKLLAEKTPEKLDFEPIGTGPFVWNKYVKDTEIRFTSFADYFEGKAKIDKLIFAIVKDPSVRLQKLKRGECNLVPDPPPSDLAAIRADGKLKLVEDNGLNVGYLALNTSKKPFDQLEVRQAINLALNKEEYLKAIYLGTASKAINPIPPTIWSYNKNTKDYAYDIDKAKVLLKKAGFADGFETTIWYMPVSRPYMPNAKKMAEMMQADLAKVGIKANLVTYDWSTYLEKARKGEHDMLLIGWIGDNGDPDNFLSVLLGCGAVEGGANYARWCNKGYDDLVNKAKLTADIKSRTKSYQAAQLIFKEQAPWVTLAHAKMFRAMSSGVVGFKINPFGPDQFYGVDLSKLDVGTK
jgi:dipeptide transport system substrate-binding protein